MAKKINNSIKKPAPVTKQPAAAGIENVPVVKDPLLPAWLYEFKAQAIIVGMLAFVLYFNTSQNEYALDDTIVIVKNEYVYEGFAGIKDILTKDAFDSYYKQFNSSNQLSGGRYRPLSIVSFAIEQQFFGAIPPDKMEDAQHPNGIYPGFGYDMKKPFEKKFIEGMHIRHFFNVLWFTLCVVLLLYFLRYVVFRSNPVMALLAAVLFAIHPIHTEVVANVKSRDEIMSLVFICLTFIYAFKYQEYKKKWMLVVGTVSYFLAFLSKEYAITLVVLLPMSFFLFYRLSVWDSIKASLPFIGVMIVYICIRLSIVAQMNKDSDNDILNNPYAKAQDDEVLPTKISTTLNYIKLLIYPKHLSADYSYNTLPYKNFSSLKVWLSLLVHGSLIVLAISFLRRLLKPVSKVKIAGIEGNNQSAGSLLSKIDIEGARILLFAISFYLLNLFLVCNIFFNIGGTMGERLIFHSSVGFCIAAAYLLYKGMEKIKNAMTGRLALGGVMVLLIVLCGFKTIERNADWKNDETLFNHDIVESPNSILVNSNVASSLINKAETEKDSLMRRYELHKGIEYYNKTLSLHNTFVSGFMNRFVAYLKLNEPDSAKTNLDMVRTYYPKYPKMEEIYYNLGVCYYMKGMIPQAISQWQTSLKLNPSYGIAQQSINTATQAMIAQQKGQQVIVK